VANSVKQWQIVAKDPDAVASFYSRLFGWTVDRGNALGYRAVKGAGIDGGIWPSPPDGHNLIQLFVEVEDIDKVLQKAMSLGAKVIVPKSTLPDGDSMAVLLDPAGLTIGVFRPAE
jgi:uncharacterized protein